MATYLTQFEKFWNSLSNELELPDGTKAIMLKAWSQITWPTTTISPTQVVSTTGTAKGKTGYSLFMQNQLAELKKDPSVSGPERMKKVVAAWKSLTTEQKKDWSNQAAGSSTVVGTVSTVSAPTTTKAARKPSGYNLFMKNKMPEVKASVSADQRMSTIGAMWKALNETQKAAWKAAAVNGTEPPIDEPSADDDEGEGDDVEEAENEVSVPVITPSPVTAPTTVTVTAPTPAPAPAPTEIAKPLPKGPVMRTTNNK